MVQRGNADFYRPEQPWEEAYPDCSDRDAWGEDNEDDGEEEERGGQAFQCFRQYYSSGPLRMQSLRSQGYYDRGADLREPEDPG